MEGEYVEHGVANGERERLVRDTVRSWRDGLVNLSASNRLLNFRPRKTSAVTIVGPDASGILRRLAAGRHFTFTELVVDMTKDAVVGAAERSGRGLEELRTTASDGELSGALRNLLRRSHQEYLDRGLRILYLAIGTLEWVDVSGAKFSSPLLLVPVELMYTGPRMLPHLAPAEDDAVLNPALTLKLADSEVELPDVSGADEIDPSAVLDQVRRAVARQRGWRVEDRTVLSYFTFAKEAMYRDLLDNEDLIAAHPGVVALTAGGRGEDVTDFDFAELRDQDVDERAPVDRTPLVLDADSSQRACIAAAVGGRSFVMDGPPGTGKSQTIANMIGALLEAGRTVLFVSEKAAALDVVRNRLAGAGLGPFLLELHSSKATRKEVATELGHALTHRPIAPPSMDAVELDRLRTRLTQLNRYAAAMNEPRAPFGRSLHSVVGRISELSDVASAPATGHPVDNLTQKRFGDITQHAQDLARAWRPALEGSTFLWRRVTRRPALTSHLEAGLRALDRLDAMLQVNNAVVREFGIGRLSQAARVADLLEHYLARPAGVPESWLTVPSPAGIEAALDQLSAQLTTLRRLRDEVSGRAGVSWSSLPLGFAQGTLSPGYPENLAPRPLDVEQLTTPAIDRLVERLLADRTRLDTARSALDDLAGLLRLPTPRTLAECDDLLFVASVAEDVDRPEAAWFRNAARDTARRALDDLQARGAALDHAEAAAVRLFDESALDADAAGLMERFRTVHTGIRKFGGACRRDKATVVSFTREGVGAADARAQLGLIVDWQKAVGEFADAAGGYSRELGSYFRGRKTDAARVSRALARAAAVSDRYPGMLLDGAAAQIAHNAYTSPSLKRAFETAGAALTEWRAAFDVAVEVGPRPQLMTGTVDGAIEWIDEHLRALQSVRKELAPVDDATDRTWNVADARGLLLLQREMQHALASFESAAEDDRTAFGDLYAGDRTDLDGLHAALVWLHRLRDMTGGALTAAQVAALGEGGDPAAVRTASDGWRERRGSVVAAFDDSRRAELTAELDDVEGARELLTALLDDAAGQDDWFAYRTSRDALEVLGLGEAVEFCVRTQVSAEQVPAVIEKAVLREWVDHHIAEDEALSPVRGTDRDALVADFRELDRRLVETSVGRIINKCNERRPRRQVGQAAVISNEAKKKKKHMPVRTLIERTQDVVQAIKPVFMMSPLAVTQYLPASLKFDVVIFDEASQVAPMDAINCVYRGSALITAGDAKQLPPTNFFALASDDGDEWVDEADDAMDFESILDLVKGSGSFRSLTLKWHYRSRHESLIAFSNTSFYSGELVTFPGADHEGPDVGVELIPVQGVYRRGSSRDNPIEAAKVAERVIHHYDSRPGRSVGVVTFSEAQASAIEAAVEEARRDRADLDEAFAESRLDGFFVKSLESVQGDERDVMIFSIGYGPDENGKTTNTFGPLNRAGGWRRLNVAVTRARYRNEIVSSLRAGDIGNSTLNEGVRHLRRYLDFAERGLPALSLSTATGGDAESPFEESVIRTIRSWGYDVTPQVGAAGYRIDMAVHHPDLPGVYVLGVECDGAQYHSSRVARDRDRLRDQVLVGLGWSMHRIWGTAWYRDRQGAEQHLKKAIESAVRMPVRGLLGGKTPEPAPERPVPRLVEVEFSEVPEWAEEYRVARIGRRPRWVEPHEAGAVDEMIFALQKIAAMEGPVHMDIVHQRFRQAWSIGQMGVRIRRRLDEALQRSAVVRDGDFLDPPGGAAVRVRTPADECRRTVEQVHPAELEAAVFNLVRDSAGIEADDVSVQVARLYGWNRVGPEISRRLTATTNELVEQGRLERSESGLRVGSIG
ncbi:DUF3320 domain-containing protein [Pseudonocardia sulfidoxydans]|uniref:DUF3320 domain-containing protein n=1 Tax=Pseudonocardia sulfidoxydans TaxID=54011 RepID=UPI001649B0BE|nr:DUF3320 domain-containing protein [Pseudonocardia sulfidoxydans]